MLSYGISNSFQPYFGQPLTCQPKLPVWIPYQFFGGGLFENIQGIGGSARKPALIQDTGYMVEKTYFDIAPYLGAFGAYLMPQ